jgi:GT2 family glycosyltransferase
VIQQIGPFWEWMFWGREGEEYALRVWAAGFKIIYYPQAVVRHRVSPHGRVSSGRYLHYELRNALAIYIVHYPMGALLRTLPTKIASSLVKGVTSGNLRYVLKAIRDVVLAMPMLLKRRMPLKPETARAYFAIQREHGPLRWTLLTWLKYKGLGGKR